MKKANREHRAGTLQLCEVAEPAGMPHGCHMTSDTYGFSCARHGSCFTGAAGPVFLPVAGLGVDPDPTTSPGSGSSGCVHDIAARNRRMESDGCEELPRLRGKRNAMPPSEATTLAEAISQLRKVVAPGLPVGLTTEYLVRLQNALEVAERRFAVSDGLAKVTNLRVNSVDNGLAL
jgi:hypothetical protein